MSNEDNIVFRLWPNTCEEMPAQDMCLLVQELIIRVLNSEILKLNGYGSNRFDCVQLTNNKLNRQNIMFLFS